MNDYKQYEIYAIISCNLECGYYRKCIFKDHINRSSSVAQMILKFCITLYAINSSTFYSCRALGCRK